MSSLLIYMLVTRISTMTVALWYAWRNSKHPTAPRLVWGIFMISFGALLCYGINQVFFYGNILSGWQNYDGLQIAFNFLFNTVANIGLMLAAIFMNRVYKTREV